MSFSQKNTLPKALAKRRKCKRAVVRTPGVSFSLHWVYPTVLIFAVVVFLTIYLCQSAHQISIQYELGAMKEHKEALQKEQREIKLAIENLESLERIEKIAKTDLAMIAPSQRVVLDLAQPTNTALLEETSMINP